MGNTKHTAEPWTVGGDEDPAPYRGANGEAPQLFVDAARIVRCVNACAGLEDPAAALKLAREAMAGVIDEADISGGSERTVSRYEIDRLRKALAALNGQA